MALAGHPALKGLLGEEEGRRSRGGSGTCGAELNILINTEASDVRGRWGTVAPPVGYWNHLSIIPYNFSYLLFSAFILTLTKGGPFFTEDQSWVC